tara:strand:+ start:131 stop:1438 length:1308 start_codon:yes stop_codon:yes gene_type:complete
MGKGQDFWKRAKKVIPGGNMLLSKRAEIFLPELWPSYFSKAKGCYIWDLDGKRLLDMNLMGVGTNILGYGNNKVDNAVRKNINFGNISSLNCIEEVLLAEKLIEMHPWAKMAKFTRTGGEANSVAIRIARAATGKDKVAVCGYHGWHDWYLAANLKEKSQLNTHLLPGLEPVGVPKELINTIFTFEYNDIDSLNEIVNNNELAAIKMEVERNLPPEKDFLNKVKKICQEKNILLIFDECTSGFRETYGGLHLKYGINPDLAIFSKALGNGYAICSIIGTESVMEYAQSTFISSTFWTERIGPTAALKTLEVMKNLKSWEIISEKGKYIKSKWAEIASNNNLKINIFGISALPSFIFDSPNFLKYKTFITQEMLKKNFLASNACYLSIAHKKQFIDNYLDLLNDIFSKIHMIESNDEDIEDYLEYGICQSGFKRLN